MQRVVAPADAVLRGVSGLATEKVRGIQCSAACFNGLGTCGGFITHFEYLHTSMLATVQRAERLLGQRVCGGGFADGDATLVLST